MENRTIYENLSPLDHRYYISNRKEFSELSRYLSESANIRYCALVEAALLKTHITFFLDNDKEKMEAVDKIVEEIDCDEVYREEEKTQHNIRALVNVITKKVPSELQPYVHLGATSVDILDTSLSLRIRDAVRRVILPLLLEVLDRLITLAEENAETPQAGRTHGQLAVPITVGFAFSEYVARLGKSILEIERRSQDVRGQLSGAVGAYNATSLMVDDPVAFEKEFCTFLNLKPSEYSNQLIEPEYTLRLLLEINVAFGIIANLADDLRNLQRSEIAEVKEAFGKQQVGSSTMPHKRNPWNSEHVKSLWKAFFPRVMSFFMDQISEHQRDLTNSASSRFIADYLSGFTAAAARLRKVLSNLTVDHEKLAYNLSLNGDMPLSEAAYILLAVSGVPEAHEIVRKITLECEEQGVRLVEQLQKYSEYWEKIENQLKITVNIPAEEFFSKPEYYCGKAAERAKQIAAKYRKVHNSIQEVLK